MHCNLPGDKADNLSGFIFLHKETAVFKVSHKLNPHQDLNIMKV